MYEAGESVAEKYLKRAQYAHDQGYFLEEDVFDLAVRMFLKENPDALNTK